MNTEVKCHDVNTFSLANLLKIQTKKSESKLLIFPPSNPFCADNIKNCWFDSCYWREKDAIIGESKGRHITWFVKPPQDATESAWVLRHYYRGGFIAKITRDNFFYSGIKNTRAFKEIGLLHIMRETGLPVPKPIGGCVRLKGLFYTADLLMEKIAAKDLVAKLKIGQLAEKLWTKIGKTIAEFHQKGIYHADLNAHNILLDEEGKVWLIDFDRCEQRVVSPLWQQQNIERLKRSLLKEKGLHTQFFFDDESWQWLLAGYRS